MEDPLDLLPGHCHHNYHLHILDLAASMNACTLCKEHVETAHHILCDFEAIATTMVVNDFHSLILN